MSDLLSHASASAVLLSVDGNVPPCPARGVSSGMSLPQVLLALQTLNDAWAPLYTALAVLVENGRGTAMAGSLPALTTAGIPTSTIAGVFPYSAGPWNPQTLVPYFWVRTA